MKIENATKKHIEYSKLEYNEGTQPVVCRDSLIEWIRFELNEFN